jgi:hypothetical protein
MKQAIANLFERRVHATRLSLCLMGAALVLAFGPSAAQAEQLETVLLTKSNPSSSESAPAGSTTPLVFGGEEGVIIAVVRFAAFSGKPAISAIKHPNNDVGIYANNSCTGTPVGTGTIEELEETGIQVAVPENAETTLYAKQSDPNGIDQASTCPSVGLDYWEGSVPATPPSEPPATPPPATRPAPSNPPVAPRLHTLPGGRANNNTPRIVGSAPGAERVKIFDTVNCGGTPIGNVSPAELADGVPVHVSDNSVTDFAGASVAGGKQSFCSPPATYIEDSMPPLTRITMGPGSKTRRHKAVFRFTDTGEDPLATSFQCKVNHGKWKPCHSPFKLRHLRFRRYVLRVRGTDEIGNAETKPVKRSFKVIH